jgi:6-phospho-beta-glucosidase
VGEVARVRDSMVSRETRRGTVNLCLVGAGGMRAPATVTVLARELSDLIGRLSLVEPDEGRLATYGELALRAGKNAGIDTVLTHSLADGLAAADAVAVAVRPGGAAGRALDERIARRFGVLAQETVGFGGVAMALRSIPAVVEVAAAMREHCPGALLVNLTNPVGALGEALARFAPDVAAVGLCDTPREVIGEARAALSGDEVELWYAGLNHLGGITSARRMGKEVLPELLGNPARFATLRGARLFGLDGLVHLGALPSDYVWFYRYPHSLGRRQAAGGLRGEAVVALDERLGHDLAEALERGAEGRAWERYWSTLRQRSQTYLAREEQLLHDGSHAHAEDQSRNPGEPAANPTASPAGNPDPDPGDDGYAGELARVIAAWAGRPVPEGLILDVPLPEATWGLPAGSVVEGRCVFDAGQWRLLATPGPAGELARIVRTVKHCEQLLVSAIEHHDATAVVEALATNPAVGDAGLARDLFDALRKEDPTIAAAW